MKILVTGAAGFIGHHTIKKLAEKGMEVVGLDSLNDYYDVDLKLARLAENGIQIDKNDDVKNREIGSTKFSGLSFIQLDLTDKANMDLVFEKKKFDVVINLAAQAGVRYSITNPMVYVQSNIVGFANLLECCKTYPVKHLVYASSSSVYGNNTKTPFSTADNVDHPISLYAATKKSNELVAHVYSSLYGLPTTGLRFFTVYGPWGRPDMALFKFTKSIFNGEAIEIYNNGDMIRDFTYVDDVVEGIWRVVNHPPIANDKPDDPSVSNCPYKIYNIGNNKPVKLNTFIEVLEKEIGIDAIKEFLPMQMGDVPVTEADVSDLVKDIGYSPDTSIQDGIARFVSWYKSYYNIQ